MMTPSSSARSLNRSGGSWHVPPRRSIVAVNSATPLSSAGSRSAPTRATTTMSTMGRVESETRKPPAPPASDTWLSGPVGGCQLLGGNSRSRGWEAGASPAATAEAD